MKQDPQWGPTNIRRHRTKNSAARRPGARGLCTPGSRVMNVPTFTFTLIFIVFNWTPSKHAPLTTVISWSHSSPVQQTWTYDRRTIRWYNLVRPSECSITLALGILCSQVMWVRIMPRAATFVSFNSCHHLSCPSVVRSQHLDRLGTQPIKEGVKQSRCGPEGSRTFRLPDFHRIPHMNVVTSSASRTDRLYPQECTWYSFSLGAESTPGPWCGRKEICHWKIQWHHRESIPGPSE